MAERDPRIETTDRPTADSDFAAWIHAQVAALKDGRFGDLDIDDLADEVESLAKRDFRKLVGALRIVLVHMLKWDKQPEGRGNSWRRSINAARDNIYGELASSPSFRPRIAEAIERAYPSARIKAAAETGVFEQLFASSCPYDWDEIMTRPHDLDPDRVPEDHNDPFQSIVSLDDDD